MKRITVLGLALLLSFAGILPVVTAQDAEEAPADEVSSDNGDADDAVVDVDDESYIDIDEEDFRPSEEIPTDQSIAFPTDI